jgi:ornithine cyclodeaminase/alanine dehydrogenase-like protein (mu-crystallin family)
MALFLSEQHVQSLGSMADAVEVVEEVFRFHGEGRVINPPRQCVDMPGGTLRITTAVVPPMERMAVKVSSTLVFSSNSGRLVLLSDTKTGRILAITEVFQLGALRTGAASGVATKHLARADAGRVGIFGAGRQARTQLLALAAVRPIRSVVAISRNSARLQQFAREMTENLNLPVSCARDAQEVYDCDILVSATTSKEPVIFGRYLKPGTHINAIGANTLERRELDDEAVQRCAVIAVDNKAQAQLEAGELAHAAAHGALDWNRVGEIGAIVAGKSPGRAEHDSITLFKSLGVAMEDVALAVRIYERAVEHGVGIEIPLTE